MLLTVSLQSDLVSEAYANKDQTSPTVPERENAISTDRESLALFVRCCNAKNGWAEASETEQQKLGL